MLQKRTLNGQGLVESNQTMTVEYADEDDFLDYQPVDSQHSAVRVQDDWSSFEHSNHASRSMAAHSDRTDHESDDLLELSSLVHDVEGSREEIERRKIPLQDHNHFE